MKKLTMILPLALLLCFMVGCQEKAAMAELEAFKVQVEVEEQNITLVKRFLEKIDKNNLDSLEVHCASDCKFYFPTRTNPFSRDEHKQLLQAVDIGFPNTLQLCYLLYSGLVTHNQAREANLADCSAYSHCT